MRIQPIDVIMERRYFTGARCTAQTRASPAFPVPLAHSEPHLKKSPPKRTVFFVSDGTGITAEMLGHSLLTQFEGIDFHQIILPFVNTPAKVQECVARINAS